MIVIDMYPEYAASITTAVLANLDKIHTATYTTYTSQLIDKAQSYMD
jgi:hypothetical protein